MLTAVVRDGAPATGVRENWEKKHAALPKGARFLHLIDNHDRDRAVIVFSDQGSLATPTDHHCPRPDPLGNR